MKEERSSGEDGIAIRQYLRQNVSLLLRLPDQRAGDPTDREVNKHAAEQIIFSLAQGSAPGAKPGKSNDTGSRSAVLVRIDVSNDRSGINSSSKRHGRRQH
jgi:hypothetical protein